MLLVTRAEWGARPPKRNVGGFSSKKGFQLHHFASPRALRDHGLCAAQMRAVQNHHMDAKGWSDIAYNFIPCNHGFVFEGRGWTTKSGASANATANSTRLAICWAGDSDRDVFDIQAADAIKALVSEGISKGWPPSVGGHRDYSSTTCPGNTLYNWMKAQVWTAPVPIPDPPKYVFPRRFSHVFQMDDSLHGSLIQQQALRDAFAAPFGSKPHALLMEFDRFYNRKYQRSAVTLEVKDFGDDLIHQELAGTVSIAFSDKLVPIGLKHWAVHAFGHVLDNTDYITQQDREWFLSMLGVVSGNWNEVRETWADAVRDWWTGISWQSLDTILLRERA